MITLHVEAATLNELVQKAADALAPLSRLGGATVSGVDADKAPRHRRTKAEIAADEAATKSAMVEVRPDAQAATSPPSGSSSAPAAAGPALTLDIVRAKLKAVNDKKGMDEVKRILAEHGLQKVSAITEDKFAAIAATADAACA